MKTSEDEKWMEIALLEARKGIGLTAPNPPVGAVIVREGVELARGWHQGAGLPHAERDALSKLAPDAIPGSTIYVTLEPCSTRGRTGACSSALVEAGVARVVYGALDPNPSHGGRADAIFEGEGIEVRSRVLEEECLHLIRAFTMVQRNSRPWAFAKTAMSLDGKITRLDGEGQWLTGKEAREEVQMLRGEVDAILTSGETMRKDNPALTLRSPRIADRKQQPWRVVLSDREVASAEYQLFTDKHQDRTLLFKKESKYDVLRTLMREHDVQSVLLEAGGRLLGSFMDEGLIDEWVIYLAPMVLGGPTVAVAGEGATGLSDRLGLKNIVIRQVGNDLCARGLVNRDCLKHLDR